MGAKEDAEDRCRCSGLAVPGAHSVLAAQFGPVMQEPDVPAAPDFHGEFFTPEHVIKYTPYWHGERFPDGRPKVPDDILDRMKNVTLEEAWATLRSAGFMHQYEDGWYSIHPDQVLVGRALTSVWMPGRPDIQKADRSAGERGSSKGWHERLARRYAAASRCVRIRPLRTQG